MSLIYLPFSISVLVATSKILQEIYARYPLIQVNTESKVKVFL